MKTPAAKWYERYEILLVLLLAGVYLGLVGISLTRQSIWHDESFTAVLIENSYAGIIERTANDVHPPLYYLLLKTWSLMFGDSIAVLRFFSAACMLAAILVTWRIIRKLYGSKAGILALAAMAVGPFLVRYGQEMRMYGLAALLASLATYVYIKIIGKKRASRAWLVAYGLLIAAGMYTQYFFVMVVAVHALHWLLAVQQGSVKDRLKSLKLFLLSAIAGILVFAPWLPVVKTQFTEVHGAFWIPHVGVETLTSTPLAMTVLQKQFQMTGLYGLLAVVTLLLLIIGYRQFWLLHNDKTSRLLFMCVVVPPILLFVLSLPPLQPSYQDRYMSFMGPFFYSILALGILAFQSRRMRLYAGVLTLGLLAFGQFNNFKEGNNHGWQPSPYFKMNSIIDQINTDDPVYSTSLWTYFDARVTLRDRDMPNHDQVLFGDYPTKWMGNVSAIYNRPDLITTDIPDDVDAFWLIDEAGTSQYSGEELDGYQAGNTYRSGYAAITKYEK